MTRRGIPSGLHIHVAVGDPDEALAVYNAARSYLPELAALAANSPFLDGSDTGLASSRLKLVDDGPPADERCAAIAGATTPIYSLTATEAGHTIRLELTANNGHGATTLASTPTPTIEAATETDTAQEVTTQSSPSGGCTTHGGTVSVSAVSSPAHLTIDQFQVTPKTVTFGTRAITTHFHVSACGGSVQGAHIYVTAVPYNVFGIPAEETTNASGWASLTLSALPGFPVSDKQQLLVMFVRATKPGDDLLGGISSRRLIAFHVSSS